MSDERDITADDIIPPVSAGRVRGIARLWLKPNAMNAEADLLALAAWLDRYSAMMRELLKESDAANNGQN